MTNVSNNPRRLSLLLMTTEEELCETKRKLTCLIQAVELFIERPGCNVQQQKAARDRLIWSLERAKEQIK